VPRRATLRYAAMVIAEEVKGAIVRISFTHHNTNKPIVGTGFLIAGGLVVTAKHVVADHQAGQTIYVTFANNDEIEVTSVQYRSATTDWALLDVGPTPGHGALELGPLRRGDHIRFASCGYANSLPTGTVYHGTFQVVGALRFELWSDNMAGERAKVPGLSGAPLLVDNYVCGVIVEASGSLGVGDGTLDAIAITSLAKHLSIEIDDPPFTTRAAIVLQPARHELSKATAHAALRIPHPELSDPQRLCHNVAASCLRCGIETTGNLSRYLIPTPLEEEHGARLLTYAAVQWIQTDSLQALQKLIDARTKLIVLDANSTTGSWYLLRLHDIATTRDYAPGTVALPRIPLDAPQVVRADLRKALRAKLRNCPNDELDEQISDLEPITVVLDLIPSSEVVKVITEALDGTDHVILAVAPAAALIHFGTLVQPGPDAAAEQLQHKAFRKATNRLHAKTAGGGT
jgi:trypsin-like peptidase